MSIKEHIPFDTVSKRLVSARKQNVPQTDARLIQTEEPSPIVSTTFVERVHEANAGTSQSLALFLVSQRFNAGLAVGDHSRMPEHQSADRKERRHG